MAEATPVSCYAALKVRSMESAGTLLKLLHQGQLSLLVTFKQPGSTCSGNQAGEAVACLATCEWLVFVDSLQRFLAPQLEDQLQLALFGVRVNSPSPVELLTLWFCEVPLQPCC